MATKQRKPKASAASKVEDDLSFITSSLPSTCLQAPSQAPSSQTSSQSSSQTSQQAQRQQDEASIKREEPKQVEILKKEEIVLRDDIVDETSNDMHREAYVTSGNTLALSGDDNAYPRGFDKNIGRGRGRGRGSHESRQFDRETRQHNRDGRQFDRDRGKHFSNANNANNAYNVYNANKYPSLTLENSGYIIRPALTGRCGNHITRDGKLMTCGADTSSCVCPAHEAEQFKLIFSIDAIEIYLKEHYPLQYKDDEKPIPLNQPDAAWNEELPAMRVIPTAIHGAYWSQTSPRRLFAVHADARSFAWEISNSEFLFGECKYHYKGGKQFMLIA